MKPSLKNKLFGKYQWLLFLTGFTTICFVPSCSERESSDQTKIGAGDQNILARVSGEVITISDLEEENQRRLLRRMPPLSKQELLDGMIDRLAILNQAKSSAIVKDKNVQREIDNVLISKFTSLQHEDKLKDIVVTDKELRQEYTRRLPEFTKEGMSRISVLRIEAGTNASPNKLNEVRDKISEARKLASGLENDGRGPAAKGFGALAVKFSDHQSSRYKGGDIGWRVIGKSDQVFPDELINAVHPLDRGTLTEIIEKNGNFYLAMKTDSRPKTVQKFEAVKSRLRVGLIQEKRQKIQKSFRDQARALAGVEINTENLKSVKFPVEKEFVKKPPDVLQDYNR